MSDARHPTDHHPELPVDADVEAASRRPAGRPRPLHIAAVTAGGAAGTLLRYGLATLIPAPAGGFPVATFATNLLGAFALGVLLEAIAAAGVEEPRATTVRLLGGTGLLGGFTTYSTFAIESVRLLQGPAAGIGIAYIAATIVLGLACGSAGIGAGARLAAAIRGRRRRVRP